MAFDGPLSIAVQVANRIIPWYGDIQPEPADEIDFHSYLGTPVFSPLEFLKVSGTSLDNSLDVGAQNGNSQTMLRIDTCIINVHQPRNIVKTPIQGRNGTVKEYISDGDFEISIEGVIISQFQNVFPRDEVQLFIELMGLPKSLPVACEFLQLFSVDSITIDSYELGQTVGSRNSVPFRIMASSDFAEEILITQR